MLRTIGLVLVALNCSLAYGGEIRFANNTQNSFKVLVRPQSQTNWVAKTDQLQPNTETQPFTLAPNAYVVHLEYSNGTGQSFRPMRLGHLASTTIKIDSRLETRNESSYIPVKRTRDDGSVFYQIVAKTKTMTVEVLVFEDEAGEVIGNAEVQGMIVPRDPLGVTVTLRDKVIVITEITPNSPATRGTDENNDRSSLRVGDRIELINEVRPSSVEEFVKYVRERSTELSIWVTRNGRLTEHKTSLVGYVKEFNAKMFACDQGLHIASELDPNQPSRLRAPDGSMAKLEPGDHIVTINGQRAYSVNELFIQCKDPSSNLEVQVLDKNGSTRWNLVYVR